MENREDRISNSSYVFRYLNDTRSWGCRKQTFVELLSIEAEYVALEEAYQEFIWIRRLSEDFLHDKQITTVIFEENQSCLKLISNKRFSHQTKHIDTKLHFVQELKEEGTMDIQYRPTNKILADMLT